MKNISVQQSGKGRAGKSLLLTHKRLYAALSFSLCMFAPGVASAASVWIDDLTDTISAGTDVPDAVMQITQEGVGILGGVDFHFEFLSTDPNRPVPGMFSILSYNILGSPTANLPGDTLSITVSGHTPTGASDFNNVSVDLHFRSDSANEMNPVPLSNALNIFETGQYQAVNSGLSDLKVEFRSDVVPVPAAVWLLGSGLLGLIGVARRK